MSHKKNPDDLNDQQARFVAEYLIDLNGTQAAIRAGYSAETARIQASKLLTKGNVQDAVAEAFAAQQQRLEIKADDILRELYRIATSDIAEAYDDNGCLKPIKQIPIDVRRAISGVKVFEEFDSGPDGERTKIGETVEVKFWSKTEAAQMLGKYLKLWIERFELKVDQSFADLLKQARERAKRR